MGYETRLLVGRITTMKGNKNLPKNYFMKMAMIDLCKVHCGEMGKLIDRVHKNSGSKYPRTYYYEGYCHKCDTEGEIIEDSYGDKLRIVPATQVLKAMKADNGQEEYRRYAMAIPMLENAINGFGGEELYCILFGY